MGMTKWLSDGGTRIDLKFEKTNVGQIRKDKAESGKMRTTGAKTEWTDARKMTDNLKTPTVGQI